MKPFHIEIVTPDGLIYDGQAESVLVRTHDGDVEILANHTDYIAPLATGRARLIIDGQKRFAAINGGFISVTKGEVKLVTITFEYSDQIDLSRAKAAKEKAENKLKAANDANTERLVKAKLARAISRIKVAGQK